MSTVSGISLPMDISVTIVSNDCSSDRFTRWLAFKNFEDKTIFLKMEFTRDHDDTFVIDEFPNTLHNLHVLGSANHFSYWDDIFLDAKQQPDSFTIDRISIAITYNKLASGCMGTIPWLDDVRIGSTSSSSNPIRLTRKIKNRMVRWCGLDENSHPAAINVAEDLGKSGSSAEGFDKFNRNPRFSGQISFECSEFVSWYYWKHTVTPRPSGSVFSKMELREVYMVDQLMEFFERTDNVFVFDDQNSEFVNTVDGSTYTPKTGDYLARYGQDGPEHSMIFLDWDEGTGVARAFNGPFPITIRELNLVQIQSRTANPKTFYIGKI